MSYSWLSYKGCRVLDLVGTQSFSATLLLPIPSSLLSFSVDFFTGFALTFSGKTYLSKICVLDFQSLINRLCVKFHIAIFLLASYADILWARHAIFLVGEEDCVTSPKNVCVGGYFSPYCCLHCLYELSTHFILMMMMMITQIDTSPELIQRSVPLRSLRILRKVLEAEEKSKMKDASWFP